MRKFKLFILIVTTSIYLWGCDSTIDSNLEIKNNLLADVYEHTKFICSDITDNSFVFISQDKMFYQDKIYNISLNSNIFINNENCIVSENSKIENFVYTFDNYYGNIFTIDKVVHFINDGKLVNGLPSFSNVTNKNLAFLNSESISVSRLNSYTEDIYNRPIFNNLVLKNDGNIYFVEVIVSRNEITKRTQTETRHSDEIIYSSEKYGFIKYFYAYPSNNNVTYDLVLFTEDGIFTLPEELNGVCENRENGKCRENLVKNEELSKYIDQIIYFDIYHFVDTNLNIYSTQDFLDLKFIPWY